MGHGHIANDQLSVMLMSSTGCVRVFTASTKRRQLAMRAAAVCEACNMSRPVC